MEDIVDTHNKRGGYGMNGDAMDDMIGAPMYQGEGVLTIAKKRGGTK